MMASRPKLELRLIGEMALRRNDFDKALEMFRSALELNNKEAEHHSKYGWALWMTSDDKATVREEVDLRLRRAEELAPKQPDTYFYQAQIAKHDQKHREALKLFEKTLELAPHHRDAQLELRLMKSRGLG